MRSIDMQSKAFKPGLGNSPFFRAHHSRLIAVFRCEEHAGYNRSSLRSGGERVFHKGNIPVEETLRRRFDFDREIQIFQTRIGCRS